MLYTATASNSLCFPVRRNLALVPKSSSRNPGTHWDGERHRHSLKQALPSVRRDLALVFKSLSKNAGTHWDREIQLCKQLKNSQAMKLRCSVFKWRFASRL